MAANNSAHCNCPERRITETTVTAFGRTFRACAPCAALYTKDQEDGEPALADAPHYTREWHVERIDRLAYDLADALEGWFQRDRERPHAAYAAAGRLTVVSRALSAATAAVGALDYQDYARGL